MSSPSSEVASGRLPGLDHDFTDPALLVRALTHRSFGTPHYERLEFLGDAILNFTVAEAVYQARPRASEGDLTRLRSRLVRDRTLAEIARELDLGRHLLLGSGELKSGGHLRDSILADAVEAVIGAVYLDAGIEAARRVVNGLLAERIRDLPEAEDLKDPKTRLQEFLQARGLPLPDYQLDAESGADHERVFTVACRVDGLDTPITARARSMRRAEQAAARKVLEALTGA